jgi:hypothetical protein
LNDLITAMDEIFVVTQDYGYRSAVPHAGTGGFFSLLRTHRYLHFGSVGNLEDPAGVEDDVSLSESENGRGTLDLDTIEWLAPGAMFWVSGCSWTWLDNQP